MNEKKELYLIDYTWWDNVLGEYERVFTSVTDQKRLVTLISKLEPEEEVHKVFHVTNQGEIREMKLIFDGRLKLVPAE